MKMLRINFLISRLDSQYLYGIFVTSKKPRLDVGVLFALKIIKNGYFKKGIHFKHYQLLFEQFADKLVIVVLTFEVVIPIFSNTISQLTYVN